MLGDIRNTLLGIDGDISGLLDSSTEAATTISYPHHEIHSGSSFFVNYSVASLGAMTTPDDAITLTFTTPNTTKWGHFTFSASGPASALVRFIEGSTGGGADPTGTLTILNSNRNSTKTSAMINVEATPAAGSVSYDATVLTGGTDLWTQYLEGSGGPQAAGAGTGTRNEIILKQNTIYQLSILSTTTTPASLYMSWYEHTDK